MILFSPCEEQVRGIDQRQSSYRELVSMSTLSRHVNKCVYTSLPPPSLSLSPLPTSRLHTNLIEHLNAEVVLRTITDVSIALQWLKSTFLFVRIKQNPKHYGIPEHLSHSQLEEKLQDLCLKDLHLLEAHGLISMVDGFDVQPRGEWSHRSLLGFCSGSNPR